MCVLGEVLLMCSYVIKVFWTPPVLPIASFLSLYRCHQTAWLSGVSGTCGGRAQHLNSNQGARRSPPREGKEELSGRLWEGPGMADAAPGV